MGKTMIKKGFLIALFIGLTATAAHDQRSYHPVEVPKLPPERLTLPPERLTLPPERLTLPPERLTLPPESPTLRPDAPTLRFSPTPTPQLSDETRSITFWLKSNYKYRVQVEFYSQNRNAAWPGNDKAYSIDDYQDHSYHFTCRVGEKICFGAWSGRKYWGVGLNNSQSCSGCCIVCGETGGSSWVLD